MAQREPPVNRIAFISNQGQLGTVAPDGGELRLLTAADRIFQFPAWSPDSTTIASVGRDRESGGIFVVPDTPAAEWGVEPLQVLYESKTRPPIYLYWHPSGQSVSFISFQSDGMALNLVPRTGGEAQEIVSGQPCFWSWAPDGERFLAHLGGADEAGTVAFVGLQGQLAGPRAPRPGIFQSPGIAPSGTRWAYGEIDVLNTTQIVVASQGSRRRTVVGHMGVAALSWSPASDVLAFISPNAPARHCYGPLQLLNPTTDERRYLVSDTVFGFFWSPDGTQIAYLTIDGLGYEHDTLSDTLAVASNTRALARRTEGEPITLTLSVVDVASGERRRLHTFRPLPIFVNQFLPFFDQYAHSHRLWSPDSDALVLPVVGANGPQIMHIPSDGRPPRVLVSGLMAFWSLR